MRLQFPFGESKRFRRRLAEEFPLEINIFRTHRPNYGAKHRVQRLPEPSLPETVQMIIRRPQQIRVREVYRRLPILLPAIIVQFRVAVSWRDGAENALLGEEQVNDYLNVQGPVSRVVEDEDGADTKRAAEFMRDGPGVGSVEGVVGDGPEAGVGGDEVCWGEDLGEAVAFSMVSGFLP